MKQDVSGVKIPGWSIGFVVAALIGIGVSRADVGNLKERVGKLENLPDTVASMRSDLASMKEQQAEMRQDIKTLLSRGR